MRTAFFIIDYSITGGVERVNANLSKLFFNNNIEASYIISLRSAQVKPDIDYPDHLEIFVLFPDGNVVDIVTTLSKFLRHHSISTLIFQGDNMTITLAVQKAARLAQCRSILHYHGSPYGYLKKYIYLADVLQKPLNAFKLLWSHIVYPFKKAKLKKVITNADGGFVCVSEGVRKELLALFALPEEMAKNVISIPNPLTFKVNNNTTFNKEKKIVYLSRLHRKHKNSMLSLKAWKILQNKYPGWKLYILGDGVLKKAMENYCMHQQLTNVIFAGMVNNVETYLQASSISILTSDCEGLGMGLLESAAYKNALVVTRADGGVTDIVEDGITGFLVPRNDSKGLAEKMSLLMNDKTAREKMGDNASKKLAYFDDSIITSLWKKLLAGK
ncbi:MAG: glycosyltransferase [Ferruginibacter sp.]